MTLIKTSLLNSIAVAVKMLTLLALNKILAVYVGPAGYAAVGQFQNAVQIVTTIASGAINIGVTKYTAEYSSDAGLQHRVWKTASGIALIGSLVSAALIVFFSKELSNYFLNDDCYVGVFVWFALTLVFFVLNTLLLAVLNGLKDIHRYVAANIAGSVVSLGLTSIMVVNFGLYGALVAFATYQSMTFFVTLFICYKASWFKLSHFLGGIDDKIAKNLASYAVMALVSAICIPTSHMMIRNYLSENLGWEAAGYWEAMWRLSSAYLLLITTTLSVYYLPRLSELKDPLEIRREIVQGYKIILPVAVVCSVVIYVMRDFIIGILFTNEFSPMRDLFAWQMIGDTLKIGSWILAYLMIGKAMVKLYIITEILYSAVFVGMSFILVSKLGLEGVALAHMLSYLFYWLILGLLLVFRVRAV